ncbi:MAG: 50S ribosomal protein L4 [Thermomicrobiales bacterium]|nr:50S ribosomal protein L4 [Thermomicrobiales bacterium]
MIVDVVDKQGAVVAQTELDDSVWGIEPNIPVMHQALVRQQANARLGTRDTKTRGEVRGGGRKPWRQKGTGRARQGSIRSPQWIGGGVVWGPHQRDFSQSMPRKMRRLAIRSALSAKVRDQQLTVMQGLSAVEPKTKAMKEVLGNLPVSRSVLIVTDGIVEPIRKSSGNLPDVWVVDARYLNVRDILKFERLLVTAEAIPVVEGLWALDEDRREPSVWKQARLAERAERVAASQEA